MTTMSLPKGLTKAERAMRLGQVLQPYAKDGLLVTPRVNKFLKEHGELTLSPDVAQTILELLSVPPRDRSGSFSPSARGNCLRAQALGFLGAPQAPLAPSTLNLFLDGRFRHLRWQALLLQAEVLDVVEIPVPMPAWLAKGSVDGGNIKERWGFELKGTRMNLAHINSAYQVIYNALDRHIEPVVTAKGQYHIKMMWKHVHQIYSYRNQLAANGYEFDRFSLVYENKETQEWREFVLEPNEWMEDKVTTELKDLHAHVGERRLPKIKDECRPEPDSNCPYNRICHDPYKHLPDKWQVFMNQEVRLVVKKRKPVPELQAQGAQEEPAEPVIRVIRKRPAKSKRPSG